ncbi:hypothetical protein So717_01200 [Roseobacter cerasinus]|uniref:Amine oxidase domain-containing protein n=1 Tax=Roseobacter cerasinus TaxID=2602289 RepID=A0A640VKU3_9RHOB|nr:FAD-dependent oxidoreductase [Roseobacter cerasinus]GFE48367.1 hypothetical protein So717_01200 [Roseobacter cerasinus]
MDTDSLIIGGGLSGLRLASLLAEHGRDFILLEGRDRFGGRILTETVGTGRYDLGPAWFWPGQPRIEALTAWLGLSRFDQYAEGILSFEDENGRVERGRGFASMQGSYRMVGGLGALVDALAAMLPKDRLRLSHPVTEIRKVDSGVEVACRSGQTFRAHKAVLALPPRVASELVFAPALPESATTTLQSTATWMAGQAKAVAVYNTAFWREAGLSGDAMSRHGPMVEIHDASPVATGPAALFGFIGVPPAARRDEQALKQAIIAQLIRLFGAQAATPRHLFVKDWAFDPFTSIELDQQPLYTHPQYGRPQALRNIWDNRLIFGGTETAAQFGGYLEGALEAAEEVHATLTMERV